MPSPHAVVAAFVFRASLFSTLPFSRFFLLPRGSFFTQWKSVVKGMGVSDVYSYVPHVCV